MQQRTVQESRSACTGCEACRLACPNHAISMRPDEEGFLVPVIASEICTNCGLCRSICPTARPDHYKHSAAPKFYVAKHISEDVLLHSTSGGAFTALSDQILGCGGVVYGADFNESLEVCHKRAENSAGRDRMRFSKYIQSRIGDAYEQVRDDLAAGRTVLFTGTPCQTAALRALFGDPKGLILCDLVCHGVPSPLLWQKYRETLGQEHHGQVNWASFRTKANGWYRGQYQIYYTVEGSTDIFEDTRFFELYLRGRYLLRPSCHTCPYGDIHRAADLTIADYWGIEQYSDKWCDRRGVSLILTHTPKGEELLLHCRDLPHEERPAQEALSEQKRLSGPVEAPKDRGDFWKIFREQGFAAASNEILLRHPELKA